MSSWEDGHIQTQGECCQKTGRDGNYAAISQGMIWVNRKWEKQARILSSGGARPCPHFGFWSSRLQNRVSSVQFRCSVMSDSVTSWISACQASLSIPTPRTYPNSCPSRWWCHPTISSSVVPFFSHLQYFPASGSFPMCQFFASGGQSTGVSASPSVLPMNIQDWFPLGWTGWIFLQLKGLSRVFTNTTVQKHQFFGAQLSSQSNSHIHTWLLEKP